ncbi:Carboxypeptidase A2 [Toxocara canis]|uniref:Carboxypeptidase A2 n=1 Tax=Toxocara canis TaxID=6265 RepID=A0A0B2VC82_TOXCA|nr:Carboxypeptidase A2 [Toxocara canis]
MLTSILSTKMLLLLTFVTSAVLRAQGRTTSTNSNGTAPPIDFNRYHDYYEVKRYLISVADMNPTFVQLRDIGTTHEGRELIGVKIGYPASATNKRAVWLDGGNHAREWPAFHTALYFVDQLVTNYGIDERITNYVNKLNIYVFPILNPDGFEFSLTSDEALIRHWRKNRAPENCTGRLGNRGGICCVGVDLNRNYDFAFVQNVAPYDNPCSDEFQGPRPFSEPETRAVRDFLFSSEVYGKLDALVSMHTHGQFFFLPYNHKRQTYPQDIDDLRSLAEKAVAAIRAFRGTKYRLGTAADLLAPATGGATDWIKKFTPTKYVYVIELPPRLSSWFAFQLRPHWLLPTAQETWHGISVIIEQVILEAELGDN